MTIQCPKCESNNVQSAKTIIEGGTSKPSGNWSGYVAGAGTSGTVGGGYVSGTTHNTSKTDLASSLEDYIFGGKPNKPRYGWILRVLTLLIGSNLLFSASGLLYGILGAIIYRKFDMIVVPVLFIPLLVFWWIWAKKAMAYKKNKKRYQTLLDGWERSTAKAYKKVYFCHQCGNRFTPGEFSEHEVLGH